MKILKKKNDKHFNEHIFIDKIIINIVKTSKI